MKLKSTLGFVDESQLRKIVVWICGRLDLPVRRVPIVTFAKSRAAFGGLYQHKGIVGCRIGGTENFPYKDTRDGHEFVIADQVECLVYLAAHELEHRKQHCDGRLRKLGRSLERITRGTGRRVLIEFRSVREKIMEKSPESSAVSAKPSLIEQRAAKVDAKLKEWEAKQKRASAKVKTYRAKARYYAKKLGSMACDGSQ